MHWLNNLMETYGKLKIAEHASDLDDNRKVLATDREVVKAHHRKHLGRDFESPETEDVIHIGDQVQHVSKTSWLMPLAVGLLSGVAGTGAIGAALLAANLLKPTDKVEQPTVQDPIQTQPQVQPQLQIPTDNDTKFRLQLVPKDTPQ